MVLFKRNYFVIAALLFAAEVCIALFVHDRFIRPYFGDFLVVILIYCSIKSFWNVSPLTAGTLVLLFSFAVELSQYFGLIHRMHLDHNRMAALILGKQFQWFDLLAYALGIVLVLCVENISGAKLSGR